MNIIKYITMSKLYLTIFTFLMICPGINQLKAQQMSLKECEDSIKSLIANIIQAKADTQRFEINAKIDKLFGEILKTNESFDYPFDSIKNVSKLKSDDGFVRIINWNMPLENGKFVYFAYVQHRDKKKKMELFRLNDKSEDITKPEFKELSDKKWYGALYYKILTNKSGKNTYYTLLGWDGNDDFTNKKLIDAFIFSGNKLIFGPSIFKVENAIQNRLIFEFAEQAQMMIRYDVNLKMIVFDHLSPAQEKFKAQFMYYGPDMSHDGIKFEKGNWVFKSNLDLRNMQETKEKPIEKSNKIINN
jgi:hypothetical protein